MEKAVQYAYEVWGVSRDADITLPTPACTASANGQAYTSCIVRSSRSELYIWNDSEPPRKCSCSLAMLGKGAGLVIVMDVEGKDRESSYSDWM